VNSESLLILGGRVVDPLTRADHKEDLLILAGKVAAHGAEARRKAPQGVATLDATGLVVAPGLVDSHVHFREPGQSAKETIATGSLAAARGGFTSVLCMPNTSPAIDSAGTVALVREKAQRDSIVNVFVTGAITVGIEGKDLAPIGSLKSAGVVAITDDGHCVQNNELMRRALEYARMFDLPLLDHCQDYDLVAGGVMHEGKWSAILGLKGWPAAGEEMIVARNIQLARLTGSPIHCQHLSAAGSVQLLRQAREEGLPITGEACPHHFTLTDCTIAGSDAFWAEAGEPLKRFFKEGEPLPSWPAFDTNFKMNPPLRSQRDREAILEGLKEGVITIIGSDHAPHCNYQKEVEFDFAPFGITGLETELPLSLMRLHHTGLLSLLDLLEKLTLNPARLLRLHNKGTLDIGADGDVTLFDPDLEWTYRNADSASKSKNSPFDGWPMKGKALATVVGGKIVWRDPLLGNKTTSNGLQPSTI